MSFLLWQDAVPARFWTIALLVLALFLASAIAPAVAKDTRHAAFRGLARLLCHPAAYLVLGGLAILAFRWPVLYFPRLLDHDEAQMGAQAIKFFTDIVPWRSVDGTTSGPLNSMWLMLPRLLGGEIDWTSIRFMGLVCVFGTVGFTYGALRELGGEALGRAGALPLAFFYMFVVSFSLLHYSSEHFPVMLTSGGIFFAAKLAYAEGLRLRWLVAAGACFGAIPFSKLQPAPLGGLGGLFLLAVVLDRTRHERKVRGRALGIWAAAGLCVPGVMLFLALAGGALGDFFTSYVGMLTTFKEKGHPASAISGLLRSDQQASALAIGCFLAGGVMIVMNSMRQGRVLWSFRRPLIWVLVYLGMAVFCVMWSGKNFPHYFLFWAHPLALCLGVLAAETSGCVVRGAPSPGGEEQTAAGRNRMAWLCIAPVLAAQLTQLYDVAPAHPHIGRIKAYLEVEQDRVVQGILQMAGPEDRMTIWGMTPSYHVDTGIPPGTRDAIAQMQILPTSKLSYYRERFLRDFKESMPKVFVDTDSPYLMMTGGSYVPYKELPQHGHEAFPELAALIRDRYTKRFEANIGETGYKIRVYARK